MTVRPRQLHCKPPRLIFIRVTAEEMQRSVNCISRPYRPCSLCHARRVLRGNCNLINGPSRMQARGDSVVSDPSTSSPPQHIPAWQIGPSSWPGCEIEYHWSQSFSFFWRWHPPPSLPITVSHHMRRKACNGLGCFPSTSRSVSPAQQSWRLIRRACLRLPPFSVRRQILQHGRYPDVQRKVRGPFPRPRWRHLPVEGRERVDERSERHDRSSSRRQRIERIRGGSARWRMRAFRTRVCRVAVARGMATVSAPVFEIFNFGKKTLQFRCCLST